MSIIMMIMIFDDQMIMIEQVVDGDDADCDENNNDVNTHG